MWKKEEEEERRAGCVSTCLLSFFLFFLLTKKSARPIRQRRAAIVEHPSLLQGKGGCSPARHLEAYRSVTLNLFQGLIFRRHRTKTLKRVQGDGMWSDGLWKPKETIGLRRATH